MASTEKLIAGGISFSATSAGFSSSDLLLFNSLASGSTVVATNAVAQGTNLDLYGELSFSLVASTATTATSFLTFYLLPLDADGSTYGDGTPSGSAQTTPPSPQFWAGSFIPRVGSTTVNGTILLGRDLPRRDFKLAVQASHGAALSASAAASIQLQTTNINLNG